MAFHPEILRAYDIRGVVGRTLMPGDGLLAGQSFGTLVRQAGGGPVVVGWDGRLSSRTLAAWLVEGLVRTGCEVRLAGLGPTPMVFHAALTGGAAGAVMVTASHNPADHNGFKFLLGGRQFLDADLRRLAETAGRGQFAAGKGRAWRLPRAAAGYVECLAAELEGRPGLRVVWDTGNGAAGPVLGALAGRLPGRHTLLFAEVDGRFPNHAPDPGDPANLAALRRAVLAERADLGIAIDGDGDRIGIVDGEGVVVDADQLLALFAEDVLAARPGAAVVADVKASSALFGAVGRMGGRPVMSRTGRAYVRARMDACGAVLGGELSGHIIFADRYLAIDDALYAAMRLLRLLADGRGRTLAQRRRALPAVVHTPEFRLPVAESAKFRVVADIRRRLIRAGTRFIAIDGLRVSAAEGWWLLRASNTEAALSARCEAATMDGLARVRSALDDHLRLCGVGR